MCVLRDRVRHPLVQMCISKEANVPTLIKPDEQLLIPHNHTYWWVSHVFISENGSDSFQAFIKLLGDRVRLKEWEKFRGGLDTKGLLCLMMMSLDVIEPHITGKSTVCSTAQQRWHQSLSLLVICEGNPRMTVYSCRERPVMQNSIPFGKMEVLMSVYPHSLSHDHGWLGSFCYMRNIFPSHSSNKAYLILSCLAISLPRGHDWDRSGIHGIWRTWNHVSRFHHAALFQGQQTTGKQQQKQINNKQHAKKRQKSKSKIHHNFHCPATTYIDNDMVTLIHQGLL